MLNIIDGVLLENERMKNEIIQLREEIFRLSDNKFLSDEAVKVSNYREQIDCALSGLDYAIRELSKILKHEDRLIAINNLKQVVQYVYALRQVKEPINKTKKKIL